MEDNIKCSLEYQCVFWIGLLIFIDSCLETFGVFCLLSEYDMEAINVLWITVSTGFKY